MNICNNLSDAQKDRPAPLFCRLPGEAAPQPAYIEFDPAARTFTPDYSGAVGEARPANVYNRLLLRIPVPATASANGLTRLMVSAPFLALAERVIAGFERGGDCDDVGVYSTDADDALTEMKQMAEQHFGDANIVQVWSAGDYIEPALQEHDDRITIEGIGTITAATTNAELGALAKIITDNAWIDNDVMFKSDTDAFDELLKLRDEQQPAAAGDYLERVKMTPEQITALALLSAALKSATDSGLFDILQGDCKSPDSINDVCDSVAAQGK